MNEEKLLFLSKAISSHGRLIMIDYIFNNPSCRFKEIDEHYRRMTGSGASHCVMLYLHKAGIVQAEVRGCSKHYTIALEKSDPLYQVLFGDAIPDETHDKVQPSLGNSLEEVCYQWDAHRRKKMVAHRFGGFCVNGLVSQTGLPKVWIQRFRQGFIDVTLRDFMRMCKVVGVKPSTILREAGK